MQSSWPFISARLQEHPEKQHELSDDLESFMHVLNYCTLRHLSAGISDAEVAHLVHCLYEAIVPSDSGSPKGSPFKLEKVQNGTPFAKGLATDHPMGHLLAELSALCRIHYESTALSKPSTCNSSPDSSMCARGSYCGAQSILPD